MTLLFLLCTGSALACANDEERGPYADEPGPWPGGGPSAGEPADGGAGGDSGSGGSGGGEAGGSGGTGGSAGQGGDGGAGGQGEPWRGCGSAISFSGTCGACLEQEEDCCTALAACSGELACELFLYCADDCDDLNCAYDCLQAHPMAMQAGSLVLICLNEVCATTCRGEMEGSLPWEE